MADYPEQRPSTLEKVGDWVKRNKEALLLTLGGLVVSEGINLTNLVPNDFVRDATEDWWGDDFAFDRPVFDAWAGEEGTEEEFGLKFNKFWGDSIVGLSDVDVDLTNDGIETDLVSAGIFEDADEAQGLADETYRAIMRDGNWGDMDEDAREDARRGALNSITSATSQAEYEEALGDLNAEVLADVVDDYTEVINMLKDGDIAVGEIDSLMQALNLSESQIQSVREAGISADERLVALNILLND